MKTTAATPFGALSKLAHILGPSPNYSLLECRAAAFAVSLGAYCLLSLQTIRPPKTDAASGDRPMLFLEFYVFFYSRLVP